MNGPNPNRSRLMKSRMKTERTESMRLARIIDAMKIAFRLVGEPSNFYVIVSAL